MSLKVVYVVGVSYSGTTLVGNTLGQLNGFFYGGELRNVWRRGFIEDRQCGCGLRFTTCPLWASVREAAFGSKPRIDVLAMARLERERSRTRELIRLAVSGESGLASHPAARCYSELEESFYRAIQAIAGCRVIVDSSKSPAYAHFLDSLPSLDVYVVHVVRDPRGSAYSRLRRGVRGSKRRELARGALVWDTWHACAERLWRGRTERYLRIRYEDFVARPEPVLQGVMTMLDEEGTTGGFLDDAGIRLRGNHTFSANRARFAQGRVELRADTEWVRSMGAGDRLLVTGLTLPLLRRYAYSVHT